jgi:hypothetical protein
MARIGCDVVTQLKVRGAYESKDRNPIFIIGKSKRTSVHAEVFIIKTREFSFYSVL